MCGCNGVVELGGVIPGRVGCEWRGFAGVGDVGEGVAVARCPGGRVGGDGRSVEELRDDAEADGEAAAEDFVCRVLDWFREVAAYPFTNEVIRDGDLEGILLEIEPGRVNEPHMKTLLSHALGDGVGQTFQLRIVCADTAHGDLLEVDQPLLLDRPQRPSVPARENAVCSGSAYPA